MGREHHLSSEPPGTWGLRAENGDTLKDTLLVETVSMALRPVEVAWKPVQEAPSEDFHRVGLGLQSHIS